MNSVYLMHAGVESSEQIGRGGSRPVEAADVERAMAGVVSGDRAVVHRAAAGRGQSRACNVAVGPNRAEGHERRPAAAMSHRAGSGPGPSHATGPSQLPTVPPRSGSPAMPARALFIQEGSARWCCILFGSATTSMNSVYLMHAGVESSEQIGRGGSRSVEVADVERAMAGVVSGDRAVVHRAAAGRGQSRACSVAVGPNRAEGHERRPAAAMSHRAGSGPGPSHATGPSQLPTVPPRSGSPAKPAPAFFMQDAWVARLTGPEQVRRNPPVSRAPHPSCRSCRRVHCLYRTPASSASPRPVPPTSAARPRVGATEPIARSGSCISNARRRRIVWADRARVGGWRRGETADLERATADVVSTARGRDATRGGGSVGTGRSEIVRSPSPSLARERARGRQVQRSQQMRDVIDVVADAVSSFDKFGNPWARPDIGGESVGTCARAQAFHQAVLLPRVEEGRATGLRPVIQTPIAASAERLPPPADTAGINSHTKGDLVHREAAPQESKGPASTPLQVNCASAGSHLSGPRAGSARIAPGGSVRRR